MQELTNELLPPDISYIRTLISNVIYIGIPESNDWVLVDAGMVTTGDNIVKGAKARFGDIPPRMIILTHGHFDHIGALEELPPSWNVPIYAGSRELPYLTGQANYPEPDPTVGGGLLARAAPLYPSKGINLGNRVQALTADGEIPGLPDWRWIATPGHTEGHISLFRERDGMLVAGDAFITVKQESVYAVLTQHKEIHGPPMYFTPDWDAARESVRHLEALQPAYAITGHGAPMAGEELRRDLTLLAREFDRMAVPEHGRYVHKT